MVKERNMTLEELNTIRDKHIVEKQNKIAELKEYSRNSIQFGIEKIVWDRIIKGFTEKPSTPRGIKTYLDIDKKEEELINLIGSKYSLEFLFEVLKNKLQKDFPLKTNLIIRYNKRWCYNPYPRYEIEVWICEDCPLGKIKKFFKNLFKCQ